MLAPVAAVPPDQDNDWVAPHQNTVSHVDPHAPLAGLPPGEGNKYLLSLTLSASQLTLLLSYHLSPLPL